VLLGVQGNFTDPLPIPTTEPSSRPREPLQGLARTSRAVGRPFDYVPRSAATYWLRMPPDTLDFQVSRFDDVLSRLHDPGMHVDRAWRSSTPTP
jgi:hypothetical protein